MTEGQTLKPTSFLITGMTCEGCARTVARVLSRVPGVTSAVVDFDLTLAVVQGTASPSQLIAAVKAAGYGVAGEIAGHEAVGNGGSQ